MWNFFYAMSVDIRLFIYLRIDDLRVRELIIKGIIII